MKVIRKSPADYTRMRWANGKGETVEIWRQDGPDGLLWRLSMATVAEDGPFSVFSGIERNLTVIEGPGFALEGEGIRLECPPLVPVAFAGDVPIAAVRTGGAVSVDFNVMTARQLPRPEVVVREAGLIRANGAVVALFALAPSITDHGPLQRHGIVLSDGDIDLVQGRGLSVRLPGVDLPAV